MQRWGRTTTPNIPKKLEQLRITLAAGEWARFSNCSDGEFYSDIVIANDCHAVIFGNQRFIENFRDSQTTFLDGTFKAVPRRPIFVQILTIFVTCMDHEFPIIHVFMQRRTRALYLNL